MSTFYVHFGWTYHEDRYNTFGEIDGIFNLYCAILEKQTNGSTTAASNVMGTTRATFRRSMYIADPARLYALKNEANTLIKLNATGPGVEGLNYVW